MARRTTPTDLAVIYVGDAAQLLTVDSAQRLHLMYRGFGELKPQKTLIRPACSVGDLFSPARGLKGPSSRLPSRQITRGTLGYFSD